MAGASNSFGAVKIVGMPSDFNSIKIFDVDSGMELSGFMGWSCSFSSGLMVATLDFGDHCEGYFIESMVITN